MFYVTRLTQNEGVCNQHFMLFCFSLEAKGCNNSLQSPGEMKLMTGYIYSNCKLERSLKGKDLFLMFSVLCRAAVA